MLVLYLWLLGGLLGIWSKTGAAPAFAAWMARRFVTGPRSAKLAAGHRVFWGGTVSTVLVGTTVKPLADDHRVSHEEHYMDSTASPIASQLAFNAVARLRAGFYLRRRGRFASSSRDSIPHC